jgi:hypothetical protein
MVSGQCAEAAAERWHRLKDAGSMAQPGQDGGGDFLARPSLEPHPKRPPCLDLGNVGPSWRDYFTGL